MSNGAAIAAPFSGPAILALGLRKATLLMAQGQWADAEREGLAVEPLAEALAQDHPADYALQRQLAKAGRTHEQLLAQSRCAIATALLEKTDSKILDIALDLGYSDHAHFTRAFRRWTGHSPQEFRQSRSSSH